MVNINNRKQQVCIIGFKTKYVVTCIWISFQLFACLHNWLVLMWILPKMDISAHLCVFLTIYAQAWNPKYSLLIRVLVGLRTHSQGLHAAQRSFYLNYKCFHNHWKPKSKLKAKFDSSHSRASSSRWIVFKYACIMKTHDLYIFVCL